MIRRMDGFGALYPHTKRTIVKRIWIPTKVTPLTNGEVCAASAHRRSCQGPRCLVEMGKRYESQYHDIDLSPRPA